MNVLGLSCGFHDSAAALVIDGRIAAAVEEERLSRRKHDPAFPGAAADVVLQVAGLEPSDVDLVVFHEKPLAVVARHVATRLRAGPAGAPTWFIETPRVVREHLGLPGQIHRWFRDRGGRSPAVHYTEHHTSHAAAAFYPSPFESAAILTIDGVGEWATSAFGQGSGAHLHVDRELRFPHSIGLLYTAFTTYCGFRANSGEGELMGLAPFGEPRFADRILEEVVEVFGDGSVAMDQRYFDYVRGRKMTSSRFHQLFEGAPRPFGSAPTQREADLAASIQSVTETVVLAMANELARSTGRRNLVLAGGVALNCVANGRLLRESSFDDVWVQPAAGDAGSSIGAALWAWHDSLGRPRVVDPDDSMHGAFLGPAFTHEEIVEWLVDESIPFEEEPTDEALFRRVANAIASGQVVGWFTGRMEFGPRALGHRSILADARSSTVQGRVNRLVKERATFRPFAPAVLRDKVGEWFAHEGDTPYMTFTAPVLERRRRDTPRAGSGGMLEDVVAQVRSEIPAVTHVDHSARVQTVDRRRNPRFAGLLEEFDRQTGCPVLLNTSFNARDEPIVCTPEDAYRTHRRIGLDLLVLERCVIGGMS